MYRKEMYKVIARETNEYINENVNSETILGNAITRAKLNTIEYKHEDVVQIDTLVVSNDNYNTNFEVLNESCNKTMHKLKNEGIENPVVLVFASAKNPGGGFLSGTNAQEEAICRASCLYYCIKDNEMYKRNREANDKTFIYLHDMQYSPKVPVIRDDQENLLSDYYEVSFITAPAPNAGKARSNNCSENVINEALNERIRRILCIAYNKGHKILILGAFGCGVFQNDPIIVSNIFKEYLDNEFKGKFQRIIFSILDGMNLKRFGPFAEKFINVN